MKPTPLRESRALLVIALPLIFAYLSDVVMIVTAKMTVGRLGAAELAAAGISTDLSYQMCIVLMGFFSVVGVLVSGALGAGRRQDAVPELLRGLLLSGLLGLGVTVLVWNLHLVLRLAHQDPDIIAMAQPYYRYFAFAILPIVLAGVLRSFVAALMRTGVVLAVAVATVILNFVLMQGLVLGHFGLPRMGIAGAGLAWAIAMWFKCVALALYTYVLVRRQKLPAHGWADGGLRRYLPLVRLGLPVAGIAAMESGLFAATSLLSGIIGAVELAAYQIVMGWISVPFVISLGISESAMVRVAYFVGAEDPAAARQSGNLAMAVGVAVPFLLVVIPVLAPGMVIDIFLDKADPLYGQIAPLVTVLLVIAAIFQVFDGLQVIATHALRGLKDAAVPLVIAGIGYWGVGMGLAWLFGFPMGYGATGLWVGLAIGLAFTGSLLAWRFEILAKRSVPRASA